MHSLLRNITVLPRLETDGEKWWIPLDAAGLTGCREPAPRTKAACLLAKQQQRTRASVSRAETFRSHSKRRSLREVRHQPLRLCVAEVRGVCLIYSSDDELPLVSGYKLGNRIR